jgi:hypothetical protein
MTRAARIVLALAVAIVGGGTIASGVAAAGTYTVIACSPMSSSGAWQPVNTAPASLAQGNQCGGTAYGPLGQITEQGALFGEDLLGSSTFVPAGALAGWSLSAPTGTTITGFSYFRSLETGQNLDWVGGLFAADGTPLDICRTATGPPCSEPNNQAPVARSGLNIGGLFFGAICQPVSPDTQCLPSGGPQHFVEADTYSIKATLAESALPTVSSVGGPLWGGGVVSGTLPVSFAASDPSGIANVTLGGSLGQVAQAPQSCDFSQVQPCPQLPAGQLSVNTQLLPDGRQILSLQATNAAGSTATVQSSPVVVDNNGPPAPSNLTATAVGGSNVVDLAWSNPPNPPQPITGAAAQLCQATCTTPVAVSTIGSAQIAAPAPGTYTVRLWLGDSFGKTGAAATTGVTVPSKGGSNGGSGSKTHLSAVLSGGRLVISGSVPPQDRGKVLVSWQTASGRRVLGRGHRSVTVRNGRFKATFRLPAKARRGRVEAAVRFHGRKLAQVVARRAGKRTT